MKNVASIEQSLKHLINSKYPKTQMDIFYKRQIIMQVYNQSDVKNWEIDIPLNLDDNEGIVIDLTFNKSKFNNEANFKRFVKAPFFKDFVLLDEGSVKSYFSVVSPPLKVNAIAHRIMNIISEIYELEEGEPLEILVRAF